VQLGINQGDELGLGGSVSAIYILQKVRDSSCIFADHSRDFSRLAGAVQAALRAFSVNL
jgi:hypothetical protein